MHMIGEHQSPQRDTFQVDETYFAALAEPVYGHTESALEQRIHEAHLTSSEQQVLRRISADYVIALTAMPKAEQDMRRMSILGELTATLPAYDDAGDAKLSRDINDDEVALVVGGQPLEPDEIEAAYQAISPSRELLDIRQAETAVDIAGFVDRTHVAPDDPFVIDANLEPLPAWVPDDVEPATIIRWDPEDCIEPTLPEELHSGLAKEIGRRVLSLFDTGKVLAQKIAS